MRKIHIALVAFLFISASCPGCLSLKEAYVPQDLLINGWYEDFKDEEKGSSFFGMEKWSTKVYKKGEFAYLSVTSIKFIVMSGREELLEKVESDIKHQAAKYGIEVEPESRISGERKNARGHETSFVIYTGKKNSHLYRFIGEVWSCSKSGISVICMGFADISEIDGIEGWKKIVGDPEGSIEGIEDSNGLIYNVVCH